MNRLRARSQLAQLEALALGQLSPLLEAGVAADEALRRVADHLPGSALRESLASAAAAVRDGEPPDEAIARVLPELGGAIRGSGRALPTCLTRLGEHQAQLHRLTRRLAAVSSYPALVSVVVFAVVVILTAVVWAATNDMVIANEVMAPVGALNGLILLDLLALALLAVACTASTAFAIRAGGAPFWVQLLPGGSAWALTEEATFLFRYAAHRDPALGDRGPADALIAASDLHRRSRRIKLAARAVRRGVPFVEALVRSGLSPEVITALHLGDRAELAAEAALDLGAELEERAALATEQLVRSFGRVLLVIVAVAVLSVYLAFLLPIFPLLGLFG